MDTDYLRVAFREDAQLAGQPPPDPYGRVLAGRQQSDRRRLASLAAGLTVAMIAVVIPIGISLVGPRDSTVAGPSLAPSADVFAEPTRGSLAKDLQFVTGVAQLSWAVPYVDGLPPPPDAPLETRHVAFAGDVAAGRWALVVGANPIGPTGDPADPSPRGDARALSDTAGVWFVGPAGASPDQMQAVTVPRGIPADLPVSLYDGPSGALVVVSAPGDVIKVSARPEVAADANVTRSYTDTGTTDGVAVLSLDPNPFDAFGIGAVQYRVTRGGVVVADGTPERYSRAEGTPEPSLQLKYLRPVAEASGDAGDLAVSMAEEILSEYGLGPEQVEFQVLYAGPLHGFEARSAALAVLTATFPSGAVLNRADWRQQLDPSPGPNSIVSLGRGVCANELSSGGVPADERALAMRCDVETGQADPATESSLVVLVPPAVAAGSVTAKVLDRSATILGSEAITDSGVIIVSLPEGASSVLITAPDGTLVTEVAISAQ